MLRQVARLARRAAGAPQQQSSLLLDQWQQAPLWQDVVQSAKQTGLWQRSACGTVAWPASGVQQQACRTISNKAYQEATQRNKKGITDGGLYLGAVVLGMIGLSYASVPLYRAFCQATGYGGAVGKAHNIEAKLKAREDKPNATLEQKCQAREIRVWFSSDVAEDMPWKFVPTQQYVTVHPGESTLAFFTAHNLGQHAITGVSTYNVVPDKAAYYFNKIQCFCFEEQRLRAGEVVDMPVFFYIDPELVDDFNCRNIHDITLSYTFFKVDEDEEDHSTADGSSSGVKLHGLGEVPASLPPSAAAAAAAAPIAAAVPAAVPTAATSAG